MAPAKHIHAPAAFILALLFSAPAFGAVAAGSDTLPKTIQFNRDIRPILTDNCYACHGPDNNKRKARLRLDTQQGLFTAVKDRSPVVPGKLNQSELFRRITSHDPDEVMPQTKSGETLSPHQVALIKRWIEQGAKYEGHWAYSPVTRPTVPVVKNRQWPRDSIDNFILTRLNAEHLQPSPEADRRTLIRRLSFDLTGLPPTPEQVQNFIADKSPRAYEDLVDQLLASPHYGERQAIFWLDAVRYADTDGFHADNYRSVYPYRDYVINAFNTNMSFDRFTIEQIAGDLLPNATMSQKIASTYNRLNRTTEEGGSQPKEYLAKYAGDRVRATSTAWLGATLGCAECHDHKFDPYSTKDFYSFEAFFADIKEVGVGKPETSAVLNDDQLAEVKKLDDIQARLKTILDTPTPELAAAQSEWERKMLAEMPVKLSEWHGLGPFNATNVEAAFKEEFAPEKDLEPSKTYLDSNKLPWLVLSNLADGKVQNGPARKKGESSAVYLFREIQADAAQPLTLSFGSDESLKVWVNGKEALAHQVSREVAPDQDRAEVQLSPGQNKLLLKLAGEKEDNRFYFKAGPPVPDEILTVLRLSQRNDDQQSQLTKYYRSIAPILEATRSELAVAVKREKEIKDNAPATLMTETVPPRVMRVLPRGNWMSEDGEIVSPAVPHFLPGPETNSTRASRLDLAHWLVARDNPLTARVFVNRLWKLYFGTGISKTLEDTGTRSEWPTHPELLDWLASKFMDSGWDVKHMVKLIVLSSAYRQSSVVDEKLRERDPFNRLIARQSALRLDAEMIRDNALAISGLLVDKIGGPSVKPYQPAGYWDQLNFPKRTYESDHGESEYRRGLYTFWCRTYFHPSLLAFDAPSREECTVERVNSNTPLQALVLLNDLTYVEAARNLAERIMRQGGSTVEQRIHWTFLRALDREPNAQEYQLLSDLFQRQINRYTQHPDDAAQLIAAGESPVAKDLSTPELASWTSLSRVVLNLHETITRY